MVNSFIIILKEQKSLPCLCTHSSEAFHNNIKKNPYYRQGNRMKNMFLITYVEKTGRELCFSLIFMVFIIYLKDLYQ